MRTLIVIAIGLALSLAFVFAAGTLDKSKTTGAYFFIALWLGFCVIDFFLGVRAGYAPREELGIHAVLFTIPALSAYLMARFL